MPAPSTPEPPASPADLALAEADRAREEFFGAASDEFDRIAAARSARLNPVSDKLDAAARVRGESRSPTPAAPLSTAAPASAPAAAAAAAPKSDAPSDGSLPSRPSAAPASAKPSSASPDATQQAAAAVKIPGPPQAAPPSQQPAAPDAAGQAPSSAQGQPDQAADIPSPDAFDRGSSRPQTRDWKALHASRDRYIAQLRAAEARVAELERSASTPAAPPPELAQQLTSLQAERDTLLARLEAVAVERSPRFEAAFKPRQEAALQTAKAAVGPDRAARIEQLLSMPESAWRDEQLESIVTEIGPTTLRAQKLLQSVADLDRISAERHSLSQRGSELFKQWQAEEQQTATRRQQERAAEAERVFTTVASDWKRAVADLDDSALATARSVYMGQDLTLQDIATASMWVAVGPKAAATAQCLQTRVAELEAELTRLRGAAPTAASDASAAAESEDALPEGVSYADAIAQRALQAGFFRR